MASKIIYIRKEFINNEFRSPLIPNHVKLLILNGFTVYIQNCDNRIYKNKEYYKNGAIITNEEWYSSLFKRAIIIGIKELRNLDKLLNSTHMYFSHSYKNQSNSKYILDSFKNSNSKLYDFEYVLDDNKKRIIAFGYYSGIVGTILGLKQYYNKINKLEDISNLKHWKSYNEMINFVKDSIITNCKIAVIGSNGRCGTGVKKMLDEFNLKYIEIDRNYDTTKLIEFDLIYNCILLDQNYNKVWFDKTTIFEKDTVIIDISSDYDKLNNPIKIYNKATTWENPIYKYNEFVDIISIDNLPSILPKESSDFFSNKLVELLLEFHSDKNNYWKNCLNIFCKTIS
jgi:saccharopine dehydrogenase (NAD+, L-lysine-forming)